MKPHPLSELLPSMPSDQFAQLVADIKANGQRQPVTVYEGQILDGRHRARACEQLGLVIRAEVFSGDEAAAAAFVCSQNLARRQLSKSQLAMVGVKFKAWHAERAKQRIAAAVKIGNKTRHGYSPAPEDLPELANRDSRDDAARQVGVSGKLIDQAEFVMKKGAPELVAKVADGGMALNEAKQIAKLPKETQRKIAAEQQSKARKLLARASEAKQTAIKKRHRKSTVVQAADAPGTLLVRTLLSRLELLSNEIERAGVTPHKFAERFLAEFDWGEPLLVRRMSYVSKAVEMIAVLNIISQRAKKEAA